MIDNPSRRLVDLHNAGGKVLGIDKVGNVACAHHTALAQNE